LNFPVEISRILEGFIPLARWRIFLGILINSPSFRVFLLSLFIFVPEVISAFPEIIYQNSSLNL